jgi:hypothetical protein
MNARIERPPVVVACALLALAGGAGAQTPPRPAPPAAGPPRVFAGYAQPAVPPSACRVVNAGEVDCQFPGMIIGRYVIETAGTSTAQGAGASHALQILVADQVCGAGRSTDAWSSGARTLRLDCAITLLSDQPVAARVLYVDDKATKDPKGPVVTIRPLAWNGVLSAVVFAPKQ